MELVRLKGVGRVRARALYAAGFTDLAKVAAAREEDLARVPHLGPGLAQSIKRQVESAACRSAPRWCF